MKYLVIILTSMLFISSCSGGHWDIELWKQKIKNSNLCIYKYDAWGGRDSHESGLKILDSLTGFQQKDVLNGYNFSYLKSIPSKDTVFAINLIPVSNQENTSLNPTFTNYHPKENLVLKTENYEYKFGTLNTSLRSYKFKSFKETKDSLIFFSNKSQFVNGKDFDRISVPKGNVYLMTSKDNKYVARIVCDNLIFSKSKDTNKINLIIPSLYFDPIDTIRTSEFSDYGIYKPVK